MGDMADWNIEQGETQYYELVHAARENDRLTDEELVQEFRGEDELTDIEIGRGIVKYWDTNGFISKKQRWVLIRHLSELDISFQ